MKIYNKPEINIIEFDAKDVICTSEPTSASTPKVEINGVNAQALPATDVSIFDY